MIPNPFAIKTFCCLVISLLFSFNIRGQHHHETAQAQPEFATNIEAQPLLAQALRIGEALSHIGSALPTTAINQLQALKHQPYDQETLRKVQEILDPYCLAIVDINPESRVKVGPGPAQATLMQEGWTTFLVKVHNQAHVTAEMQVESPNAQPILHSSTRSPRMKARSGICPKIQERTVLFRHPMPGSYGRWGHGSLWTSGSHNPAGFGSLPV